MTLPSVSPVRSARIGNVAVIYASDYLNRFNGERLERECRLRLGEGCRALVVDFRHTDLVNSIGVSMLRGVIDVAEKAGARLIFADVNGQAAQLFELLGLMRDVALAPNEQAALTLLAESETTTTADTTPHSD
ncbi:MAG: STAS domain-containing protein [Pyrinomonadaceae bacterium]|nr:STAS domain-containing protein [Pyrinomonadaceae bacterium]